jgi:hypothetical protein
MTSDLEQLELAGLALNDAVNFTIEELVFHPAEKKPQWASNADADGDALVREAHYSNAVLEVTVRVEPAASADEAREKLGELTDALQACERTEDGAELVWIPNGSATSYTGYALLGEYSELPIAVDGDGAGWFLNAPLVKIKLTLRPFLYTEERVVLSAVESGAEPLQVVYVGGIKGDVPAEARLVLKDTATQDRRYASWGRDVVEGEENPALLITAANLSIEGFSGARKTRSGAYSEEKVIRATAVSSATTACSTGRIKHVGSFAVYMRVYTASEDARFRISYKNGDSPLVPLPWKQAPVIEGFADLSMGEVFLDEVELGEQTSEIRIEVKSVGAAIEVDAPNFLTLLPTTKGSGRARGLATTTPTNLVVYDEFIQSPGGAATGKSPYIGGVYAAATNSDATDFEVDDTNDRLIRTATGDTGTIIPTFVAPGRAIGAGTTKYVNHLVANDLTFEGGYGSQLAGGHIVRWVDSENFILVYIIENPTGHGWQLVVYKYKAKVTTALAYVLLNRPIGPLTGRLETFVQEGGLSIYFAGLNVATAKDADLAPGGALAEGRAFLYDHYIGSLAATRIYHKLEVLEVPPPGHACFSGHQIEFGPDGVERQDSTGTYDGPPTFYRGANFEVAPAGDNEAVNRIAARMRRNDVEEAVDSAVVDKQKIEVLATERFLVPR